jgi:hypothetical protein
MKKLILILVVLSGSAFAQDFRPENPQYKSEGKMLVLRFAPKDKAAKVFLAGQKVADIDFNKDSQLVSVVRVTDKEREKLEFTNLGDYYEVRSRTGFTRNDEVVFHARVRGETQQIKIKLNSSKP